MNSQITPRIQAFSLGFWDPDAAEWRSGDPYERHPAWREAAAVEDELGLEWDDPFEGLPDFFVDDPGDYFDSPEDELAVRRFVVGLSPADLGGRAVA